jgi:hypothetical protein
MKSLILLLLFVAMAGCSTVAEREFNSFWQGLVNYSKSVSDDKDQITVPDSVFYSESLSIAMRHHQVTFEKIFRMMRLEAIKKERGLPNQLDDLEVKLKNSDPSLSSTAEAYDLNMKADAKCAEFGLKQNTPEFNKCVYDYKVTYLNLMMQQQQLMSQAMPRPAPLIVPTQTHTNCNPTYGGGFSCTTR